MQQPSRQEDPAAGPGRPTFKVAAVASRLGVAPATLRTWARRYGLGPPAHTAGAHRQYTEEDLARLHVMRRLTLEGVAPAEAARVALATGVADLVTGAGDHLAARTDAPGPTLLTLAGSPPGNGRGSVTGSGATAAGPAALSARPGLSADDAAALTRDASDRVDLLLGAARSVDHRRQRALVDAVLAERGVVATWEELAVPALRAVTGFWESGGDGVEIEHSLSGALLDGLRRVVDRAGPTTRGPALLSCAQEEGRSLPLHALAAALAERGIGSRVAGARVRHTALLAAVERTRPQVVLLYATGPVPQQQLAQLDDLESRVALLLGGPGWQGVPVPRGAVMAGSLAAAVGQVHLAVPR